MRQIMMTVVFAALISIQVNAAAAVGNNDVAGKWKYEVPQAPYGYQKGVISFTQTEGELEGEVRFQDGYKIKLKNVSYKEDLLKFGLYIDYEYIKVEARVEGQGMKGMVDSSEGKMTFTAGKVLPPPPENK